MRFNARELAVVVQQTTNFDKEGYLLMKEKQEGFFKKSEAYVNRYIRLKGNLLFYFKSKDSRADPLGVIVLERCAVELAVDDDVSSGFLLVFEGEDQAFRFGASTEAVRDEWIQALHIASHECLKMQLQSLREQLQTKTGNVDIVHLPVEPNSTVDFESQTDNTSQDPVLEISLACCNLPNDSSDVPPNALVVVHTMLPPQQQIWMHHNHTEIVEKSNNPQFLKTIGFGDKFGIDTATKVRLTVHHVVERMTGTMTQVGQAIFTLQDLLMSNDLSLTLTLRTHDLKDKGTITVTSWINDERVSLNELQTQQAGSYSKRPRTFSLGRHSHNLQAHFNDIIKRSFRFATNDEKSMIQVSEYMAESKWTFEIPIQLLQLWVNEEKQMISLLQDLGELPFDQAYVVQETSDYCMSMVVSYNQHAAHLLEYTGVTFKRSADRGKQELEFVPANLHVERMVVSSDHAPSGKVYDITTVGAFTTHCRDMKNGGLKRLMHNVRSSIAQEVSSQPRAKMQQACTILNEVTELRTQLRSQCEKMLLAAELENAESVVSLIASMKDKVARLNSLCAEPLIESAAESYLSAKRNANTGEGCDSSSLKNISEHEASSTELDRKSASISGFTQSSPMEPWEVTRLNMEAAFVCLVSVVEDLTRQKSQDRRDLLVDIDVPAEETGPRPMLQDIKPAMTKMQGFLDIVCSRLSLFLTFLAVLENKDQVRTMNDLKIRRDIVNAHAITTLVSAFAALTQTDQMANPQFTDQLCSIGILFQLEGLLSCYGSELCMLEDTIIGVEDLNHVSFRLVPANEKDFTPKASLGSFVREGLYPNISRHNIIIDMPVEKDVFSHLPRDLQQGKQIKVTAMAFNIGINEQATLAEKFGSTALQERLNMESFAKLYEYYIQYSKYYDDPLDKSLGLGSLHHMVKMLQNNVMTKKSKNVEVLHVASAVTRALKGLRATFCKSGKDRTAMAVTLEMVHILQRHHNLASHVFIQSLDCLRSVGCRRDNTLKNTGVKKYAFISLQMLYIPKLYRAPSGTYGNVQT